MSFSNFSKSVSKRFSRISHLIGTSAPALVGALVSGSEATLEGDIYDNLRSTIGGKRYDALCKDASSKVMSIRYCRAALGTNSKAHVLNHDFLWIEMLFKSGEVLTIRAEKCGVDMIGIIIDSVPNGNIEHKLISTTFKCGVQMGLEQLKAILVKPDPDYSLVEKNCWKYAFDVTEALLAECSRMATTAEEKERLRRIDVRSKLGSSYIRTLFSSSSSNASEKILLV